MAIKRNEVVFNSQPTPPPNNENKLAQFLASIGKFVETPQGQQTATNLASGIPLLFGRSDIASGITGAGQQTYDNQIQEQKAREEQAFRDLQNQLAQTQQDINNKNTANNQAIAQGRLNLGIDTLESRNNQNAIANQLAQDTLNSRMQHNQNISENKGNVVMGQTGAPIPNGYVKKDPEIAKNIPPSLLQKAQNGDLYVNSHELPNHQVNTLDYNVDGKPEKEVVFTNTPEQAVDLNIVTEETKLLIDLIDEAYILREKYGKESMIGNKDVKSRYEFLSSEMGLKIKNVYGLGVLSNTDVDQFIKKMVPDLNGFFDSTIFAKLNQLRRSAINDLETHKNVYVYDSKKDILNQFAIKPSSGPLNITQENGKSAMVAGEEN